VGVSADHPATLEAFTKQNKIGYPLLADFRRVMLPGYDALVTDEKSPIFRYAKRAYYVIDKNGVVRYMKVQDNALDLLDPADVLKALKDSGA
jgi:peroxiredoxin